jgi:hypothetical protein
MVAFSNRWTCGGSYQIPIGSFYRPPDSDEKAIQELERSLSKIKKDKRYRNAKILLGGDINLGDINWLFPVFFYCVHVCS